MDKADFAAHVYGGFFVFALLECLVLPRQSLRGRIIRAAKGEVPFVFGRGALSGAEFLRLTLSLESGTRADRAERLYKKAAARLRRMRISEIVFPRGFERAEVFAEKGIIQESPLELYRKTAAEMLFFLLRARGEDPVSGTAAVFTPRATREAAAAAAALCGGFRSLALCCRSGGERLAAAIQRELGASVLLNPGRGILREIKYFIFFGGAEEHPRMGLGGRCAAVNVTGGPLDFDGLEISGAEFLIPERLLDGWPRGADRTALAAQLVKRGALRAGELRIGALISLGSPVRLS